jgi:hypothetical protein
VGASHTTVQSIITIHYHHQHHQARAQSINPSSQSIITIIIIRRARGRFDAAGSVERGGGGHFAESEL